MPASVTTSGVKLSIAVIILFLETRDCIEKSDFVIRGAGQPSIKENQFLLKNHRHLHVYKWKYIIITLDKAKWNLSLTFRTKGHWYPRKV